MSSCRDFMGSVQRVHDSKMFDPSRRLVISCAEGLYPPPHPWILALPGDPPMLRLALRFFAAILVIGLSAQLALAGGGKDKDKEVKDGKDKDVKDGKDKDK